MHCDGFSGSAPGARVNLSTDPRLWTSSVNSPLAFRFVAIVGDTEWPLADALRYQPRASVTVALPSVPALHPPATVRFAVHVQDARGGEAGPFEAAAATPVGPSGVSGACVGALPAAFGIYAACVVEQREAFATDVVTLLLEGLRAVMVEKAAAWPAEEVCGRGFACSGAEVTRWLCVCFGLEVQRRASVLPASDRETGAQ